LFNSENNRYLTKKRLRIAYISSCLPRRCGIATFTDNLNRALESKLGRNTGVFIALNNTGETGESYHYPPEVIFQIEQENLEDYREAAALINSYNVDLVSLQHEFGLFGGADGSHIVELLRHLRKPAVTTLHTVLTRPTLGQHKAIIEIAALSRRLVVMNELALEILKGTYGIPEQKAHLIYHGVTDTPYIDPLFYKHQLNLVNRQVILTFGFVSPNKGLEIMLEAMPPVIKKFPEALYIILGVTHPGVKEQYGEEYREMLKKIVKNYSLEKNVLFINEFVDELTMGTYLGAADIVALPYHSEEQITSGVLSQALGRGKAIISTPYHHAKVALSGGRGRLVHFKDSAGLSEALLELLEDREKRNYMAFQAFSLGKKMSWGKVAGEYAALFERTVDEDFGENHFFKKNKYLHILPPVNLQFLKSLTDDTGIIQHTRYGVASRSHGYSTDDAARALVACSAYHNLFHSEPVMPLIEKYLAFILHARQENGWFANIINFQLQFEDREISQDTFGRSLWGLGTAMGLCRSEGQNLLAQEIFDQSLPLLDELTYSRSMAYSAIGLDAYLQQLPAAEKIKEVLKMIAEKLLGFFRQHASAEWPWFEPFFTYDNARLPQALLLAYRHFPREEYLQTALKSLDFLTSVHFQNSYFDLVGNEGWFYKGKQKAVFSQQPLDAGALVECCLLAHTLSGKEEYLDLSYAAFQWFLGRNRLGKALYLADTGACADGLDNHGVSKNKGAESTTALLMALLALYRWEMYDRYGSMLKTKSGLKE
jgi:glycosyltransferase involved in cell wall biosynthesis